MVDSVTDGAGEFHARRIVNHRRDTFRRKTVGVKMVPRSSTRNDDGSGTGEGAGGAAGEQA